MDKVNLGKIIQKRRDFLCLKQEDVSEITGITGKTIYLIENGKGNTSLDILQTILDVLGLEIFIQIKKLDEWKQQFFFGLLSEGINKDIQCRLLKIDEDDDFTRLIQTAGKISARYPTDLKIRTGKIINMTAVMKKLDCSLKDLQPPLFLRWKAFFNWLFLIILFQTEMHI